MRALLALVLIVPGLAGSACADGLSAGGASDCGGDAFSSATVVEHRPPQRGPLTATPETLCPDLTPQQAQPNLNIYVDPFLSPQNGAGTGSAPYGGHPPRSGRP